MATSQNSARYKVSGRESIQYRQKQLERQIAAAADFNLSNATIDYLIGQCSALTAVNQERKQDYRDLLIKWYEMGKPLPPQFERESQSFKDGVNAALCELIHQISPRRHGR